MARIDIVIPNYNYARYLPDCVASIQRQGVADLRVLIVDNASTDNSVEVAQELARSDPRITLLTRSKNTGFHASVNFGIDWAQSEYFVMQCADDFYPTGALSQAFTFMEDNPNVGFCFGTQLEYIDGKPLPSLAPVAPYAWKIVHGTDYISSRCRRPAAPLGTSGMLVRTSVQKQVGHWCESVVAATDHEMILRLATFSDAGIADGLFCWRREHESNFSHDYLREAAPLLESLKVTFDVYFAHEGKLLTGAADLARLTDENLSANAYWWALRELKRGNIANARRLAALVWRLRPQHFVVPPMAYIMRDGGPISRLAQGLRSSGRPA